MGNFVKYKIIILLSFALFASGANAKSPPPGSGAGDVPANILLMLDTSGSMDTELPGGETRYPSDVAFDSNNNIYVAKYYDQIEKYDSSGTFVTSWGSSGSSNGKFDNIYSIAIDSSDNIYVADYNNSRVQKFNTSGVYQSKFSVAGGRAYGLDVDSSGNIYVINGNKKVEKHNSSGTLLQTWNTTNSRYIAIDNANSRAYVTRNGSGNSNKKVEVYDLSGNSISSFSPGFAPLGIDVDSSTNVYVTDNSNDKIYKFNSSGTQLATWGTTGSTLGKFNSPMGVEIRPNDGKVYIADFNNHRIQSNTGEILLATELKTRLETMQTVIKAIVSDSNLTSGANFGLMTWNSVGAQQMRVNVSSAGASSIYSFVDTLSASGSTYLAPAMSLAQTYFTGASSPMIAGAECQQNILIVISDGFWFDNPDPTAANLYSNYGIKTFAIGFTTGDGSSYVSLSDAGHSSPDSPLFAEDESGMIDALTTYITKIISTQSTFTTPTIIPGITNSDNILQSTFSFKSNHQWKGHLYKYALNNDGSIGALAWDAGSILNQTPAANRNIWTVADSITHSTNNFTDVNIDRLRSPISENSSTSLNDVALTNLINFIRGIDSYSEFPSGTDDDGDTLLTGERWKLADIYHSKAADVGAPSAFYSDEANVKSESYYRAINGYQSFKTSNDCGGSCAARPETIYVGSNSGMLHAFDATTGDERWGFIPPGLLPYLRNVISSQSAQSTSIYGVDGSPAIKDIKIGSSWKTVLLGGLRQGSPSYYALDITDPLNPTHLFSFMFNKNTNIVSYWDSSNVRTNYAAASVPTAYDYTALGESWSDPLILNIDVGSGTRKWVGVFGGGYNNNVVSSVGSVVYVIDLENGGQVLQKITIPDNNGSDGILNAVPPRLTAITADTTNTFTAAGALVYFTDISGSLWKINLTDSGTLYAKTRVFDAEATYTNDRLCYFSTTPSILSDGKLMQFFGTADISRIGNISSSIANRIYGVTDSDYPSYVNITSPFTVSSMLDVSTNAAICPSASQKGWYINLGSSEKITAAATARSNEVIFSRYTPDSSNVCNNGTSRISEHNFACGGTFRTTELGTGMATEAVVYKDKLYIGVSSDAPADNLPSGFVKQGNLIIGTPYNNPVTDVKIEYWKEDF